MGDKFARNAEKRLKLPEGWFDTDHISKSLPVSRLSDQEQELLELWARMPPNLRSHVIALVRAATLPADPHYLEWEERQERLNKRRSQTTPN